MSKLTTENLELRVRTLEDADALLKLYSDNDVAQHLGGLTKDRDAIVKSVFTSDSHWRKNGFGFWSIYLKDKKEFVGSAGLRRGTDAQVEFLIHLNKKFWRKGYGTEAAKSILDFGFRLFKLKKVIASADEKNLAALGLLKTLGFQQTAPNQFEKTA